mmetsp:Transcript_12377/g.34985  ORF Transcript_12377/g.34985 Transcript_12377/m.34985 type:complete len:178 (+) Transcript_12377:43-576(+)
MAAGRRASRVGERRLTRKASLFAVPLDDPDVPLSRRPLFWLYVLVFATLLPLFVAMSASFLLHDGDIPPAPTDAFVDASGQPCGYLGGACGLESSEPPSHAPTLYPTLPPQPTAAPTTAVPSHSPTPQPSRNPTASPTNFPTESPTPKPTKSPTKSPTLDPTAAPVPGPTPFPFAIG